MSFSSRSAHRGVFEEPGCSRSVFLMTSLWQRQHLPSCTCSFREDAVILAPVHRGSRRDRPQPFLELAVGRATGSTCNRRDRRSAPSRSPVVRDPHSVPTSFLPVSTFFRVQSRGCSLFLMAAFSAGRPKASQPKGGGGRPRPSSSGSGATASPDAGSCGKWPHVDVARRIGEHFEHVVFLLGAPRGCD